MLLACLVIACHGLLSNDIYCRLEVYEMFFKIFLSLCQSKNSSKCTPILLYGLESLPLYKSDKLPRFYKKCFLPRLSVRLSVTLVDCDHIGWNSSEIISPLVSLGCSLSADPNNRGLLQGEHPEILAQSDPLNLLI